MTTSNTDPKATPDPAAPSLEQQVKDLGTTVGKLSTIIETLAPKGKADPKADPAPGGKPDPKADPATPPGDPTSLRQHAQNDVDAATKQKNLEASLTTAISFNLGLGGFVKDHKTFLPENTEKILEHANKQTYDSPLEKANAIKIAMVEEFFNLEANEKELIPTQKKILDDFRKASQTGKQSQIAAVFESVFEPTLETLKKVRRASELNRGGSNYTPTDADDAYAQRLHKQAKQTYLGEKA